MQRLPFLIALICSFYLHAQNTWSTHAGASAAGLAYNTVANTDAWCGHHNQAATVFTEDITLALSYQNRYFIGDFNLANLSFIYPLENGAASFNMNFFGSELYNESKIGLAYARKLSDRFSLGLQINYHGSSIINEGSLHAASFEAGIIAKPTEKLNIGFHIFNPSSAGFNQMEIYQIPVLARLGFRYSFTEKFMLVAEARSDNYQNERLGAGLEYQILKYLILRAGFSEIDDSSFMAGFGFNLKKTQFNIAYEKTTIARYPTLVFGLQTIF